ARGGQLPAALRAPALLEAAYLANYSGERERGLTLNQAARKECEEAVRLARREEDCLALVHALVFQSLAAAECGDLDAVWRCGVEARQLLKTTPEPILLALVLEVMARVPLQRGGWQAARTLLEERLAICRQLGGADMLIHALGAMGHVER